MSLDFRQSRERVREALLQYKAGLDLEWDPFAAAWIAYAVSQEAIPSNPLLRQMIDTLEGWAKRPDEPRFQKHLGPLSLTAYLLCATGNQSRADEISDQVLLKVSQISPESRFSPLRDPEQVFALALGVNTKKVAPHRAKLVDDLARQLQGPLKRRVLYAAALQELGESCAPGSLSETQDLGDAIAAVWWAERYQPAERQRCWQVVESVRDDCGLVPAADTAAVPRRVLSVPELCMFYEALVRETTSPDPDLLFDSYPLHPRIKAVAESSFRKGEYADAVQHAAKALNDILRRVAGLNVNDTELVRAVFGDPSGEIRNPRLRVNPLDPDSQDFRSQQNEQRGISYLAHGVIFAFRHPKAHEPKDSPLYGAIHAQKALDELVTMSYLARVAEGAKK